MKDYCGDKKIHWHNWKKPETEEQYPEFYKKIRESDAWMKYLLYLTIHTIKERNITKSDKAKAWNLWVDAKKRLVTDLNEESASMCDSIVGLIIRNDLAHWHSTGI
jgi:hypothetical protein